MSLTPAEKLKKKRAQIILKHSKCSELFFIYQNAKYIDDYFSESYSKSEAANFLTSERHPFSIVALGGYGRSEQCVSSDVDVMILFDGTTPHKAEEIIREIIYPLWDIGLDVGHATRTIDECLTLIDNDLEIMTSLLDARLICGSSELFSKLMTAIKSSVFNSQVKNINRIKEKCSERHENFGDSSDLLEPNLKNGLGGLRDYHSMLWLGKVRSFIDSPEDLGIMGFFSESEYESFKDALEFIWIVRNHLHIISKRKCDQLYFEFQEAIARAMKFKKKRGQKPVERFIGVLHAKMELVKQNHHLFVAEIGRTKKFFISKNMFKRSKVSGLMVSKSMLNFTSESAVVQNPELLMQIFLESSRLKLPLCTAARRTVVKYGHLIENFRFSFQSRKNFERLMKSSSEDFNIFNDMLSTDFLGQYIPEFDKILNRIQYNQYHIYPVDRHSIQVLLSVRGFTSEKSREETPLYFDLYSEVQNKNVLHWASLFHDIGKGAGIGEHSIAGSRIAQKILYKKGLSDKNIKAVSFLIENHLFLINIAKRRDIDDEETAVLCARKIKDADRLKMLFLLTVADSISTGPNAWNSWTASLLRDLFFKVLEILELGDIVSKRKVKSLQNKREKVLATDLDKCIDRDELEKLIDSMSPRYLVNNSKRKIIRHIKLYKTIGSLEFAMKVRRNKKSSSRTAIICGKSQAGYFSKVAGVYTLNGFDILDAKIYSWGKKTILDIFTIKPLHDEIREEVKLKNVEIDFEKVLTGRLDLKTALMEKKKKTQVKTPVHISEKKDKVLIDNTSSSFFTIIEVYSYDFPGLLFAVTNTLFQNNLDIVYAKIGNHVDQVVDTFYVRAMAGGKVYSQELLAEIQAKILDEMKNFGPEDIV